MFIGLLQPFQCFQFEADIGSIAKITAEETGSTAKAELAKRENLFGFLKRSAFREKVLFELISSSWPLACKRPNSVSSQWFRACETYNWDLSYRSPRP